jgi:DNA-binding MarR family transcriptional regulator
VAPCIDLGDPFQDLKHRSLKRVRQNSGFSASEATRLINSLKSAKYLQTSPRAGDRRFLQLEVTPLGRKIIWRSFRAVMADFGQFKQFEPLSNKICEGISTFKKEITARDLYLDRHISVVDVNAEDVIPST